MSKIVDKLFGTHSERELKRIMPLVDKVESLKPTFEAMSDSELADMTRKYKERLAQGETLDDLLPEAFATVREAARRTLNMEHFRVQIIGGIILHQGRIAEMRTGEGKTLVSTLPAYLNALTGEGVYVVTVNDYLAKRDAEWMGKIHEFLGLKVGVVLVLFGIIYTVVSKRFIAGIWHAGFGVVFVVLALLLVAGYNNTAYYPSTADLQSSLTLANSCSSEFTLRTMFYVSLLVPFVLAYIVYAWRAIEKKKITKDEIQGDDHAY